MLTCISPDVDLIRALLLEHKPQTCICIGARIMMTEKMPIPASEFYVGHGVQYDCIDIDEADGGYCIDLSQPQNFHLAHQYDFVVDLSPTGIFISPGVAWKSIYQYWKNIFDLANVGGILLTKVPRSGNWPGVAIYYYTREFFEALAILSDLRIISNSETRVPKMRYSASVVAVLQKCGSHFPSYPEFLTLRLSTK